MSKSNIEDNGAVYKPTYTEVYERIEALSDERDKLYNEIRKFNERIEDEMKLLEALS
jgi:hypothetical protein